MEKKQHKNVRTTADVRRAIQQSGDSVRSLAARYGINPKTVAKWRARDFVDDQKTGPRHPASTVLTRQEEALIVAFRRQTKGSLDDCLESLRAQIPHLTRSSLHRCLKRHGISRLSASVEDGPAHATAQTRPAPSHKRRPRNPESTREAILRAARSRFAQDGPEGLSLSEVARLAGVNRGTAYQHFKTRDQLVKATAEWVSDKLFRAVFGDPKAIGERPVGAIDVAALIDQLANFAMDNPELSRAWLLQVLSSEDPADDIFWREYQGSTERFAKTDLAQHNVDSEVLSVIILAGAFLWPVWARAKAKTDKDLRDLAYRFSQECLRISMYGNLRSEHYPQIAARLKADKT